MSMKSRRHMVFSLSATLFAAGCVGSPDDGTNAVGGDNPVKNVIYKGSEREQIGEDQFIRYPIDLDEQATIDYRVNVVDGQNIDTLLIEDTYLDEFKNREQLKYYKEGSALDTSYAQREATVRSGNYLLIIDNSNALEAKPPTDMKDNIVTVEVEYEVYN